MAQASYLDHVVLLAALEGEALHTRVSRTLRDAITRGLIPEGTRLLGHQKLAQWLGVSRNTLVDALGCNSEMRGRKSLLTKGMKGKRPRNRDSSGS